MPPVSTGEHLVTNSSKQEVDLEAGLFKISQQSFCKRAVCARAVLGRRPMLGGVGYEHTALGLEWEQARDRLIG